MRAMITNISVIENKINSGTNDDYFYLGLKLEKGEKTNRLYIIITINNNFDGGTFLHHSTETTFNIGLITLDSITLQDKRLDFLIDLALVSHAHARMAIVCKNPDYVIFPIYLDRETLKSVLIKQLITDMN